MSNQIPTLFIGVGGIGCRIVASVSDRISEEDRRVTGFIGLDTDVGDIKRLQLENRNLKLIKLSGDYRIQDILEKYPETNSWFPDEKLLKKKKIDRGSGQVRAISRLAFFVSEKEGKLDCIFDETKRILCPNNIGVSSLNVIIVGSLAGGTGSALFIELPFYIRNEFKKRKFEQYKIDGLFIGADVLEHIQPGLYCKDNVINNGYAALKEFNAFNVHHITNNYLPDEVISSIELENYDSSDVSPFNAPYESLYLLEKQSAIAYLENVSLSALIQYISQILMELLLIPTGIIWNTSLSQRIRGNMINRIAGIGMCKLVFPVEKAREYVTLSLVKDFVCKEWLILDKQFGEQFKLALRNRELDKTVRIPQIGDVYIDEFNKAINNPEPNNIVNKYVNEAFTLMDGKYISNSALYMDLIEREIEEILCSEEVIEAQKDCVVNMQNMKDFSHATDEVNRVWVSMRMLTIFAKRITVEKTIYFINDCFPSYTKDMQLKKDSPLCIYTLLAKVHPVVARFLIYDLIRRLSDELECLQDDFYQLKIGISAIEHEDFDLERDGVQSPQDALVGVIDDYNPIWRMLGKVGQSIYSEEKAMKSFTAKLNQVSSTHIYKVRDYIRVNIKHKVFTMLLERLHSLSEGYESFFTTIDKTSKQIEEKMNALEQPSDSLGEIKVYSSSEALKKMDSEFRQNNNGCFFMSAREAIALFEEIYSLQIEKRNVLGEHSILLPEAKKRAIDNMNERMNYLYTNTIVSAMRQYVANYGTNSINLSLYDALSRDYQLSGIRDVTFDDYVKKCISDAAIKSAPMIATRNTNPGEERVFMTLSPANAVQNNINYTFGRYFYPNSNINNIIIDQKVKDEEIVITKISYYFAVEDLENYGMNSAFSKIYERRIRMPELSDSMQDIAITPHLDKRWHLEAYLPALCSEERKKNKKDVILTFIYGLGFDWFIKLPYRDEVDSNGNPIMRWAVHTDGLGFLFVKKNESLIGVEFIDLYNSIFYNPWIKKQILGNAKDEFSYLKAYKTSDSIAKLLFSNDFICNLIQAKENTMGSAEINIFDIFLAMYSKMKSQEWNELVFGLRDILWEVFGYFFDGDAELINRNTKRVLKAIYDHSSLATSTCYTEGQSELKSIYEKMTTEEFV